MQLGNILVRAPIADQAVLFQIQVGDQFLHLIGYYSTAMPDFLLSY